MNLKEIRTAGDFLKQLRLRDLNTQGAMAKKCGKTVSFWSALENGKAIPDSIVDFVTSEFHLKPQQIKHFKVLVADSRKQQKLDMSAVTDPEAKELAIVFAKHLKDLNQDQISSIKKILSRK